MVNWVGWCMRGKKLTGSDALILVPVRPGTERVEMNTTNHSISHTRKHTHWVHKVDAFLVAQMRQVLTQREREN